MKFIKRTPLSFQLLHILPASPYKKQDKSKHVAQTVLEQAQPHIYTSTHVQAVINA